MQSALLMCLTSNDPQGKMKDRRIRKKRQKCRKKDVEKAFVSSLLLHL